MPDHGDRLITLTQRQRVRGGWGEYRVLTTTWAEARAYKLRWLAVRQANLKRGLSVLDTKSSYAVGEWAYDHISGTLSELNAFDDYVASA